MKAVFGMLLIGGGIVLLFGELTGKITFPFTPATATTIGSNTSVSTPAVLPTALPGATYPTNQH